MCKYFRIMGVRGTAFFVRCTTWKGYATKTAQPGKVMGQRDYNLERLWDKISVISDTPNLC